MDIAKEIEFYIGIDPGLTGAWAVLDQDGQLISHGTTPTARQGGLVGRFVDGPILTHQLTPFNRAMAFVEEVGVRRGDGAVSMFSFGRSFGTALGVLAGLGIKTQTVRPDAWKRAMGLIGGKKAASIRLAKFLTKIEISDHNVAEAIILARFCWLNRDKILPNIIFAEDEKKKGPTLAGKKKVGRKEGEGEDLGVLVVDD